MTEFFNMGGYAFYVWPSFAITTVVLLQIVIAPIARHRKALRKAADYHENNQPEED